MKQLIPCFRMRSTFSFIFSFSASSISATFAVESTRTLEPKIWHKQTRSHFTVEDEQKQWKLKTPVIWNETMTVDVGVIVSMIHSCQKSFLLRTSCSWWWIEATVWGRGSSSYLDLVCVHAGVGDQDVGVLQPLRLIHSDLLVQQETCRNTSANQKRELSLYRWGGQWLWRPRAITFIQVGVCEASSKLLDDVDGLQVPGALQPHHSVDGQLGKMIFVVSQQFGGQSGPGDVQ